MKGSKTDVNGPKVQTTAKYTQFDASARTGTNRCNAKTIFVAIYGIHKSKTKTCFSQNFKSKNIAFKLKNKL